MGLGAFGGNMTAEEDEILWNGLQRLYEGWVSGKIQPSQALLMYSAWKGVTGPFGWGGVAPLLDPGLRGPAAYVFGRKMLSGAQKDPQKAKVFFEAALADAPADSALRRLAAEKLALLKGQ
jgi:hypothetical protein